MFVCEYRHMRLDYSRYTNVLKSKLKLFIWFKIVCSTYLPNSFHVGVYLGFICLFGVEFRESVEVERTIRAWRYLGNVKSVIKASLKWQVKNTVCQTKPIIIPWVSHEPIRTEERSKLRKTKLLAREIYVKRCPWLWY